MAIPKGILAVERPKGTIVKKSFDRYLVIKRTSRRVNGKPKPVDLGTVGEIIDGKYVEIRPVPKKKQSHVDIKDYGEFALCNLAAGDLLQELAKVFDIKTAKQLYMIALLRASDKDIKNRDLQFAYETSFASEVYPGIPLSENTVSQMLLNVGMEYRYIREFMRKRIESFAGEQIVIDGMLKDCNSTTDTFSEWSRKGSKKGSMDINLIYAYDMASQEPVAVKPYPGNMLDLTAVLDFVSDFSITSSLLVMDKGFSSASVLSKLRQVDGVSYIVPLKQSSRKVKENGLLEPFATVLNGYSEATILYKKVRMEDGCFLYAFRDPRCAYEQQIGYITFGKKKGTYSEDKFLSKLDQFGLIVFESNLISIRLKSIAPIPAVGRLKPCLASTRTSLTLIPLMFTETIASTLQNLSITCRLSLIPVSGNWSLKTLLLQSTLSVRYFAISPSANAFVLAILIPGSLTSP